MAARKTVGVKRHRRSPPSRPHLYPHLGVWVGGTVSVKPFDVLRTSRLAQRAYIHQPRATPWVLGTLLSKALKGRNSCVTQMLRPFRWGFAKNMVKYPG